MAGLNINDVVNVQIDLSPKAIPQRNFGALLILGDTDGVIDTTERLRFYADLDGVEADFGTTAPEFLAADLFFSQEPQPSFLYIGRYARVASHGLLHGGVLTPAEQVLANFTVITTGSFHIVIDGIGADITGINLSTALNINGVAALIQDKLNDTFVGATVLWDSSLKRFTITSGTTGPTSSVSWTTAAGSGTNISSLIKTSSSLASSPVEGVAAETLVEGVTALAELSSDWYGLTVATAVMPSDAEFEAAAQFIEGSTRSRVFGVTIQNTNVLDGTTSADLASAMQTLGLKRTFTQYSSSSPYAIASMYGRAFTVNFEANNTTITLKFKQEPGVAAEQITESQAQTLKNKNCNVFVAYQATAAIIQEGVMCNGYFFDEVHGTDWLQNALQVALFNLLYQSQTKIPQTDEGVHQLVTECEHVMDRAVNNALVAPGVWNVGGFGQLKQGQTLTKGYYVFAESVALQAQSDREQRKAPPITIAAKLAGAIHSANVLVRVNR